MGLPMVVVWIYSGVVDDAVARSQALDFLGLDLPLATESRPDCDVT